LHRFSQQANFSLLHIIVAGAAMDEGANRSVIGGLLDGDNS